MKINMNTFLKLQEITGMTYKTIGNKDDEEIMLLDTDEALEDVITEFGVVEENYADLKEKINKKIEELENHKFLIDMVDKWSESEKSTYEKLTNQIQVLKELLGD